MQKDIKAVITDIDGTLFSHNLKKLVTISQVYS